MGIADHLQIPVRNPKPADAVVCTATSPCLVADVTATTGSSVPSKRTLHRRQLRHAHRDRVQQVVFLTELQFRGLRRELAELKSEMVADRTLSKETLLQYRPLSFVKASSPKKEPAIPETTTAEATASRNPHASCVKSDAKLETPEHGIVFSQPQQEMLLGFLRAGMTPVLETLAKRFVELEYKVDELSSHVTDGMSNLLPDYLANSCTSAGLEHTYALNPDAEEFIPSGSASSPLQPSTADADKSESVWAEKQSSYAMSPMPASGSEESQVQQAVSYLVSAGKQHKRLATYTFMRTSSGTRLGVQEDRVVETDCDGHADGFFEDFDISLTFVRPDCKTEWKDPNWLLDAGFRLISPAVFGCERAWSKMTEMERIQICDSAVTRFNSCNGVTWEAWFPYFARRRGVEYKIDYQR